MRKCKLNRFGSINVTMWMLIFTDGHFVVIRISTLAH